MPTPDEDLVTQAAAAPPAPPAEETESRGRGRPTIAEINERKAALDAREADLAAREAEAELAAAEANLAMREAQLLARQQQAQQPVAAGRLSARTGTIRSDDITEPVRGRRFKGGMDMPDRFHIPPQDIPLGISYQWNNHTVFGQEDRAYSSFMEMQGWQPVPASRHPHLVPKDAPPNSPIIIAGQILMERPQELTDEALAEELAKARGEVRMKEEQLFGTPAGTLPRARANGTSEFNQVSRRVERPEAELPRGNYQYEGANGSVIE